MSKPPKFDPTHLTDAMRESAQQIWLAGVGAFSKAQQEGGKVFENLVNDGLSMQRKTQAVAEEKWNQATQRMTDMAEQISSKTTGSMDRLETIFEDRVVKALIRQGYPTPNDWLALQNRVLALEEALRSAGVVSAPTQRAKTTTGGKTTGKTASPRASRAVNTAAKTTAKTTAKTPGKASARRSPGASTR